MSWKSGANKQITQRYSKLEISNNQTKFIFIFLLNLLNSLKKSTAFSLIQKRVYQQIKFNYYNRHINSKTSINRNCVLTNRSRAVYRPFGLSRCILKTLLTNGVIPGYSKAIW
jgi:ribosomal protein S14